MARDRRYGSSGGRYVCDLGKLSRSSRIDPNNRISDERAEFRRRRSCGLTLILAGNGVHVDRISEGRTTSSTPPDCASGGRQYVALWHSRVAFARHLSLG